MDGRGVHGRRKLDFVHQTVSCWEVHVGGARDHCTIVSAHCRVTLVGVAF